MKSEPCVQTPADTGRRVESAFRYSGIPKRFLDLLLFVLVAPFAVPIIAILALSVRAGDGGPAFHYQLRVGRNGKTFRMLKLRTMSVDAETVLQEFLDRNPRADEEWQVMQKLSDDPRITRLGRFLRKTSLDELPQIFNVLAGDMSFVGPRPFLSDQEEIYRANGGSDYFDVKPGITGYWQVFGRGRTTFADRVRYDNQYLRSVTFLGDVKLLLRTVTAVMRGTGR